MNDARTGIPLHPEYRPPLSRRKIVSGFMRGVFAGAVLFAAARVRSQQIDLQQPSIALLSPARMTVEDARTAAGAQANIARSARFYGYALDSSYSYRQIACPVAPRHLLLAYESAGTAGGISRFTAVVSRSAEEELAERHRSAQIVPILRSGTAPFLTAVANPHSIEVFNAAISPAPGGAAIAREAQAGREPLLLRGLCFLAMIGEEPQALRVPALEVATVHAPAPTIQFLAKGKTRQLISARKNAASYRVWSLLFSSEGRLVSAAREERPVERAAPVEDAASIEAPVSSPPAPVAPAMATSRTTAPIATTRAGEKPSLPTPAAEIPPAVEDTRATATVPAASPASAAAQAAPTSLAAGKRLAKKLPLPLPPGRFIPDPPAPPGRLVPDSALQSPPHVPQ